uniref:Mos1 transposase HTH domain-containing protein n=1 Tax=Acrobeloides nanus TaxID=290746 RepID=A0A914EC09_9BILA
MRTDNHIHLRHIMLWNFEKGMFAAATFREINQFFGEGTIGQNTVKNWFRRFKSGDISLEDKEERGRPSDFDDQALLAAVEEDESLTTRILAKQFDVDHSTIVRRLKKLGKIWKLAGWVPHELSDQNKANRVRIFSDLLQRNEETPFLNNWSPGTSHGSSSKIPKERRSALIPVKLPKEFRRPYTLRRPCDTLRRPTVF